MATVFVEVRFLKDVPAIVGADMKTYGPFKKGTIAALPKANAEILIKMGAAERRYKPPKKPTLKELMKGEVLTGYIEAAKVVPLGAEVKLSGEDSGRLADLFLGLLEEAGVSLPARFKREFEEAMDIYKSYAENVDLIEEAAKRIIVRETGEEYPRRARIGYRVGEPEEANAKKVIEFEVVELENEHILVDVGKALNVTPTLPVIKGAIDERFGPDAEAMWLCDTPEHAVKRYGPGEAYSVEIPPDAIVISDLGADGKLWIWPSTAEEEALMLRSKMQEMKRRVKRLKEMDESLKKVKGGK